MTGLAPRAQWGNHRRYTTSVGGGQGRGRKERVSLWVLRGTDVRRVRETPRHSGFPQNPLANRALAQELGTLVRQRSKGSNRAARGMARGPRRPTPSQALKGRRNRANVFTWVARSGLGLTGRSGSRGVAPGWSVSAPSGRDEAFPSH